VHAFNNVLKVVKTDWVSKVAKAARDVQRFIRKHNTSLAI
jgi:hypothetical protein